MHDLCREVPSERSGDLAGEVVAELGGVSRAPTGDDARRPCLANRRRMKVSFLPRWVALESFEPLVRDGEGSAGLVDEGAALERAS